MFKVLKVTSALAVLWISSIICEDCLNQSGIWGGVDPTVFYYCNTTTNQSETVQCSPNTAADGRGFVDNGTVLGCVPWEDWDDACVSKVDPSTITCTGQSLTQPIGVASPLVFYLCFQENTAPVALECLNNTGFIAKNMYMGCFPWGLWRNISGC